MQFLWHIIQVTKKLYKEKKGGNFLLCSFKQHKRFDNCRRSYISLKHIISMLFSSPVETPRSAALKTKLALT